MCVCKLAPPQTNGLGVLYKCPQNPRASDRPCVRIPLPLPPHRQFEAVQTRMFFKESPQRYLHPQETDNLPFTLVYKDEIEFYLLLNCKYVMQFKTGGKKKTHDGSVLVCSIYCF